MRQRGWLALEVLVKDVCALGKRLENGPFTVLGPPRALAVNDNIWAMQVAGRGPGRKIVLVDEVWRFCSPAFIPPELAACVQTGRKWELETVFATQRPQRINESILGEVTEAVSFHLIGANAVEKMAANYDFNAEEIGRLPAGHWVSRSMVTGGEMRGRMW